MEEAKTTKVVWAHGKGIGFRYSVHGRSAGEPTGENAYQLRSVVGGDRVRPYGTLWSEVEHRLPYLEAWIRRDVYTSEAHAIESLRELIQVG